MGSGVIMCFSVGSGGFSCGKGGSMGKLGFPKGEGGRFCGNLVMVGFPPRKLGLGLSVGEEVGWVFPQGSGGCGFSPMRSGGLWGFLAGSGFSPEHNSFQFSQDAAVVFPL